MANKRSPRKWVVTRRGEQIEVVDAVYAERLEAALREIVDDGAWNLESARRIALAALSEQPEDCERCKGKKLVPVGYGAEGICPDCH